MRVTIAVVAAIAVAAGVVALAYPRQSRSYLRHWKGSPSQTTTYEPLPAGAALHLAVAGDVGDSGTRLDATAAAMARLHDGDPFDDLLLLGDNVYPAGDPSRLPATVFEPFEPVLTGSHAATLLAILGNHDDANGTAQLAALGMRRRWWSVEREDVLLVGLDSNRVDDREQRRWLETTLRRSDATWKIVAVHHPPYSAGYQGSSRAVRDTFVPLFERYDVQLVLSGHDHDYQRSKVINGVTYVVTGAAGAPGGTGEAGFTAVSFSWHSFVELAVYADRIVGRALNQDDRMADQWTLRP